TSTSNGYASFGWTCSLAITPERYPAGAKSAGNPRTLAKVCWLWVAWASPYWPHWWVGMPVRMVARLGLHEETDANPCVNRVPDLASASMLGVLATGSP